jgi:hypothetical protein
LYGQNKDNRKNYKNNKPNFTKKAKIDPAKPSVYLDFERIGKGEPLYADDIEDRVYLKLVNNTKWSIYVGAFVFGDDDKEIGLYHEIEKENNDLSNMETPKGYKQGDARSPDSELRSGKSISFSVPKNHLTNNLKIRVDFTYDWEYGIEINSLIYSNPRHSVFFSNSDLMKYLKEKKKI